MDEDSNAIVKRRGPDNKTWYVVAHAPDMATAEIPAGLLRTASIPVFLFREAAGSSAIPLTFGLLGGVDVAVPEAYYAEASALLDADDEEDTDRIRGVLPEGEDADLYDDDLDSDSDDDLDGENG